MKALKMEMKKAKHTEHERKSNLQTQKQLLTVLVEECKSQFLQCKENMKDCHRQIMETKNKLET
jgi:hypothetical protein